MDGGNGGSGTSGDARGPGGNGQGSTTREFGSPEGTLYSSGGWGMDAAHTQDEAANTGNGGDSRRRQRHGRGQRHRGDQKYEVMWMNYAVVEEGLVSNVIWLNDSNADEFPNAVPLGDVPAGIGDTYDGAHFYRDGERVRTLLEQAQAQAQDMRAALALLGVTEESEVRP